MTTDGPTGGDGTGGDSTGGDGTGGDGAAAPRRAGPARGALSWVLLAIPMAALAWPPLYNRAEPAILGVPFFYAYQVLAVPLAALCMVAAQRLGRRHRPEPSRPPS